MDVRTITADQFLLLWISIDIDEMTELYRDGAGV